MSRYADRTEVSSDRSRTEIEKTLRRYRATAFAYGWDAAAATVMFEIAHRRVLFRLPMPNRNDREFTHTPSRGYRRSEASIDEAYEQGVRQRWRALALVIKAKLEAVEAGITTVEQEFLAHIVMPDGRTVGEHTLPRIAEAYETGRMLALLPGGER
ncbi:hypothetical protein ABZS66_19040 [Dactylosporangium sp. NPDC005572]|uniref:hypothetical protein n=1 Tax=Dactylosporangium sp. NPDC005572 TaxID=3156889 RepID=UPI0033A0F008